MMTTTSKATEPSITVTETTTQDLACAELELCIARHEQHARNALAALARAGHSDRYRRGGRSERTTAREWRRVKRHMASARRARAFLEALQTR